ncbi:MAG: long-chain fatty acid--CoA ligase [Deltaproteobacteria bacterium]|nr:MAG: long-chain fatty acid--CoA ligase [Deltaproteobacteria bacterium]
MTDRPWQRFYDWNVPETIRYPRILAHELIYIASTSFPDKPATHFFGTEISFWELRKQILRMANALAKAGVRKGDRVGVHLPNSPQYIISFYAVLHLGAIVVNLNPMYTPNELEGLASDTGLSTLITFDMVLPNIKELCQKVEIKRVIVTRITDYIEGFGKSTPQELDLEEGWLHFSKMLDESSDTRLPKVDIAFDDPALIQFTGGTTGLPKGAVLTHSNLVAGTMQCSLWGSATTGLTPVEKRNVMAILPYFHVYGTVVALNWGMFNCATQIIAPRFELDEIMNIIAGFDQITFFPAVPTMINAIINHPKAMEIELGKKLGLFNSGGGPMPTELIEQAKDMGISFSEGWGMSETTSLGIANPLMGLRKAGSIGIPFPDTDVKLVDIETGTTEVPKGEPGELIIRSPLVMKEYWNNPEETANQLKDGWLYTGDIATRDDDDYFYIVDRKKDMIIAGGYNIYPREIDEVLYEHPKVADAVSVGVPDEYRGETVKAFVVLKPGETATEEEIIEFCRKKLAAYKTPKAVEFRDELPKSAVGKILRKVLRQEELSKK